MDASESAGKLTESCVHPPLYQKLQYNTHHALHLSRVISGAFGDLYKELTVVWRSASHHVLCIIDQKMGK